MFYFRIVNDTVIQIAADLTLENYRDPSWISRHDITSFEHAEQIASQANALVGAGPVLIPVDNGENCWPR